MNDALVWVGIVLLITGCVLGYVYLDKVTRD